MVVNTPGYPPLAPQLTMAAHITITTLVPAATLTQVPPWPLETLLTLSKTPTFVQPAGDYQE